MHALNEKRPACLIFNIIDSVCRSAFILRVLIFSSCLLVTQSSMALFSLKEGQFSTTAELRALYDGNIATSQTDPVDDIIFSFVPGFNYSRSNSLVGTNANIELEAGRFYQNRRLNFENLNIELSFDYPLLENSNWESHFTSKFKENSTPNPIIGERTDSEVFSILGGFRYNFLPIYGVGIDASSDTTKSLVTDSGTKLSDVEQGVLNAQLFYKYSDLLVYKFRYRYREHTIIGNKADTISMLNAAKMSGKDQVLTFGFEGSLTSLLSGEVEFGRFRRELNDLMGSGYGLFSATNLIWTIRPNVTTASLAFIADTTPTPVNDSITSRNLSLEINHFFSEYIASSLDISFGTTNFTSTLVNSVPRKDHTYGYNFGLTYKFNEYLSAHCRGGYSWTETNSGPGYKRTTVEFGLQTKH